MTDEQLIEAYEYPKYVEVAFSTLNIRDAIEEMNAHAREGYVHIETISVQTSGRPNRDAPAEPIARGFFIMEHQPGLETVIEIDGPVGYDPSLFDESNVGAADALSSSVFSSSPSAEQDALTAAVLNNSDEDDLDYEEDEDEDEGWDDEETEESLAQEDEDDSSIEIEKSEV